MELNKQRFKGNNKIIIKSIVGVLYIILQINNVEKLSDLPSATIHSIQITHRFTKI